MGRPPKRRPKHDHYQEFRAAYEASGFTKDEIAGHLRVSLDTVKCWTKSRNSANAWSVPPWAVELLAAKIAAKK